MKIFFNDWMSILRIFVIGICGYASLIIILRNSGTRTLSKMNSFDLIVTIALGSTFATSLLQKSVSLADAVFAFALLVGLQYALTYFSVRSPKFNRMVKDNPVLLFAKDDFLEGPMLKAHVSRDEVIAGIRMQGIASLEEVLFVVLETNGEITAVRKSKSVQDFNSEKRIALSSHVTPDPKKYS